MLFLEVKNASAKVDKKGLLVGKIKEDIVGSNTLIEHKPYSAHAFKALKKSHLLAFVNGKRGGRITKDTFRLKEKLI